MNDLLFLLQSPSAKNKVVDQRFEQYFEILFGKEKITKFFKSNNFFLLLVTTETKQNRNSRMLHEFDQRGNQQALKRLFNLKFMYK